MVKRLLKLFHREVSSLHKAAILLAAATIGSSLLALLRDRLLAGSFGAGHELDIYYAAFRIPDFLYTLSLFLVSITVLIPFFLERVEKDPEKARHFIDSIFTVLVWGILAFAVIVFFLVPFLVKLVAPGFSIVDQKELIILTRILLVSPIFMGISNLFSSVIQSFRRFYVYALAPLLYNLGIIAGIVFFYPVFGLEGIAFGVVIGAVMYFLVKVPTIIKLGFVPRFIAVPNFSEIKKVVLLSIPRAFGLGADQLLLVFITAVSSMLIAGSLSVFTFSYNLQSILVAVIGLSYSVAAFPTLSRLFASGEKEEFARNIIIAGRQIIFWLIPASILLIVLRAQIVRVLFGYGKFGWDDTRLTAAALALFAISVTAQALMYLFIRGFYAAGKTKVPVLINIISDLFIVALIPSLLWLFKNNLGFQSAFVKVMRVDNIGESANVLMLPLAFSIGIILEAFWLIFSFQKYIGWGNVQKKIGKDFFQIITASLLMGTVSYFSLNVFDKIFDINTFIGIFAQGFFAGLFGALIWFAVLWYSKNRELQEVVDSIKQKFWRSPSTIAPEPEKLP